MEKAEIFADKPFEGDVDVNANGQWIAASQNGVFLSLGSPTIWQEVLLANGGKLVSSNTIKIHCRISDSGSWVVINRFGIFKSSAADPYVGDTVTNSVGINNAYDVDMSSNGNWIASNSQGTCRFLTSTGTTTLVLTSGNPANGSLSLRRIVKINANGDWVIMTTAGVYKNGLQVLTNVSSTNIGGNNLYWSLDFNSQGDWVTISSRGTFLNGTRISVAPNPDSSTTVEANDVGEMVVKITDQDLSNNFTWMAISPKGIYRNGERITPDLGFITGQTQYTLDINNSAAWIAGSESAALLNGNIIFNDGLSVQTNNGNTNELLFKINEFGDYVCLTNNGVFRNEDRNLTNAKLALNNSQFSPTSFKHLVSLGSNGAVALLSENTSITDRTGVYWGMNVLTLAPPQPVNASLAGNTLSWTNGGGSTAGYLIGVGTAPSPPSASTGSTLYVGADPTFTINNFSDFQPGVINYIVLAALNADGAESPPLVFEYQTAPLQVTGQTFDPANQQVTLSWSSLPGKSYRIEKSLELAAWQPLTEIPPGNAAISAATINPAEWNMTRTFSDPTMTTKGFYRVKTPP